MDEEKKAGKQEPKKTVTAKIEKKVSITFKQNRKFDLHIAKTMVTFYGRETKRIPLSWLDREEFKPIKNLFIVGDK